MAGLVRSLLSPASVASPIQMLHDGWSRLERSLRARILVPTSVLFTATLATMVAAAAAIHGAQIEEAARDHAELSANLIAGTVSAALADAGGEGAGDELSSAMAVIRQHHEDISWISFLAPGGEVVLSTRPELLGSFPWPAGSLAAKLVVQRDTYAVLRPVLVPPCRECSARPVLAGWLELRFSRAASRAAHERLDRTLLLTAVPSLLLLLAIAWWLLGREAIRPLRRLVSVMRTAEEGSYDVFADEGRPDELGLAARGFDAVLATLRKSQDELTAVYRERLERADRFALVGEVATGLAHEIKNPLAGLSGALELLAEDLATVPAHAEVVAEMRRQVARLAGTMEALLGFARPGKPRMERILVNASLARALFLVEHQGAFSRIRVVRSLAADLPPVSGDAGQLEQVFLNLCLNACQAMARDGGTLTVRTRARDGGVVVELADTGPGIPVAARPRIFQPFFTTREKGNGLGLAISERIVSEHGGRIAFICPPAGGTLFTVTLPAAAGGLREAA